MWNEGKCNEQIKGKRQKQKRKKCLNENKNRRKRCRCGTTRAVDVEFNVALVKFINDFFVCYCC